MLNIAKVPGYCRHKARNLAYVTLGGQVHYLGRYNSPESRAAYDRLLANWMRQGRQVQPPATPPTPEPPPQKLLICEFAMLYLEYARQRYPKLVQFSAIKTAFVELVKLFATTPLTEFGPKSLKKVREAFIARGLVRSVVNRHVRTLRNGMKWAVAEELCPGEVYHRLIAVENLRRGETSVREGKRVKPVDEAIVNKTIEHVSREVAAMVRLQLLTGARSGEIVIMRATDIDMTGEIWIYRPQYHKTEHHGHERTIAIGPRGQEVIRPFLTGNPSRYLFSPAKAENARRKALHKARITPDSCGNGIGTNRACHPERQPGDHYTSSSYNRAIKMAAERAFPLPESLARKIITPESRRKKPRLEIQQEWWSRLTPAMRAKVKEWRREHHWHVHQLRHTAATRLRETFGLDQVQATLGHATLQATQIYAELQQTKALEVARLVG